jgi:hypothetical protein
VNLFVHIRYVSQALSCAGGECRVLVSSPMLSCRSAQARHTIQTRQCVAMTGSPLPSAMTLLHLAHRPLSWCRLMRVLRRKLHVARARDVGPMSRVVRPHGHLHAGGSQQWLVSALTDDWPPTDVSRQNLPTCRQVCIGAFSRIGVAGTIGLWRRETASLRERARRRSRSRAV